MVLVGRELPMGPVGSGLSPPRGGRPGMLSHTRVPHQPSEPFSGVSTQAQGRDLVARTLHRTQSHHTASATTTG